MSQTRANLTPSTGTSTSDGRTTTTVIAATVIAATAINVVIFLIFRAAGADYDNSTLGEPVGVSNVVMMTVAPLLIGLIVVALASLRSPRLLNIGRWVGAALAIVTIVMTATGGFDALSFVSLALMHVVVAAAIVVGLGAIKR